MRRPQRIIIAVGCLCLLLVCGVGLVRYWADARRVETERQIFQELRADPTDPPEEIPRLGSVLQDFTVVFPHAEAEEDQPAATPVVQGWPDNPSMTVSASLQKLRRRNSDVVGWLSIPDLLEEPVVQRDNTYYLKRDTAGYHNGNGALFLEEHISLRSRPDTYIIFGHNMKNGKMFGSLRLYENPAYYRDNPIVDFSVLYEEARYVIFAVADVDLIYGLSHYAPFMQLPGMGAEQREACLRQLQLYSCIDTRVNVTAEDQLLLMVTCEGSDDSRRVVAARRLREGETDETVAAVARNAYKR